jgi:hypothetical protein
MKIDISRGSLNKIFWGLHFKDLSFNPYMQLIVIEEISYAATCEVQLETIPISLGT